MECASSASDATGCLNVDRLCSCAMQFSGSITVCGSAVAKIVYNQHLLPGNQRSQQAEGGLTCKASVNIFSSKISSMSCRVAAGTCTGIEEGVGW